MKNNNPEVSPATLAIKTSGLKLAEIAARIHKHLKRIESDPSVNLKLRSGTSSYWNAGACASGRYVQVCYVSYQGQSGLSKADALKYLEWLDAGNAGKHYIALEAVHEPK